MTETKAIYAHTSSPPATNDMKTRMAELRRRALQAPETWQPEPGEALIGQITGSQKASGQYGENYQMLVKDETGQTYAVWLTPWLKENLRVQGAEQGDLIALTFLGKRQSPSGRMYNGYSLTVEKAG